ATVGGHEAMVSMVALGCGVALLPEVVLHGANFDEAKAKAIELSQQQGFTWVPPFDHPMVIAGQGTLALE
ncbi:hypothetical protein, partial [Vibrio cholerae]|uniref:hypothetical protein n=1 Tax=Vibrio cholerae TaxID=666 RepID=UPI001C118BBC